MYKIIVNFVLMTKKKKKRSSEFFTKSPKKDHPENCLLKKVMGKFLKKVSVEKWYGL